MGRTFATVVGVVAIIGLALAGGPAVGLADDADDGDSVDEPSPVPASFYGTVSIDGESTPEGTELVATIDGDERGSITVDDDGEYGGPGVFDEKLVVDGNAEDENATITFLVDGEEADRTATWREGKTTAFDVTLEEPEEDEDDGRLPGIEDGDRIDDDDDRNEDLDADDGGVENGDETREDDRNDENEPTDNLEETDYRDDGEDRTDDRDEDDAGSDDAVPGFGVAVGVVAVLSGVLCKVVRRHPW